MVRLIIYEIANPRESYLASELDRYVIWWGIDGLIRSNNLTYNLIALIPSL